MNYLKDKRGLLIEGTAIIIAFLLSTAMVYLFWEKEDAEELVIGQMLIDVYSAEAEAEKFGYFFEKNSEYALLKGLKQNVVAGLLEGTECESLYALDKEECELENLIEVFGNNVGDQSKRNFEEDYSYEGYVLNFEEMDFETRNSDGKLIMNVNSDEVLEFGNDAEREMSYTVKVDYDVKLDFDFRLYENMIKPLKNNLLCLESPEDIGYEYSSVSNCLNAYPEFSNLEKENGILSFDYIVNGVLFEKELTGPFKLDLEGFRIYSMQDISDIA